MYNTVVVTGCCVLISVPTATLGAYGLIRNGGKICDQDLKFDIVVKDVSTDVVGDSLFIIATNFGTGRYKIYFWL